MLKVNVQTRLEGTAQTLIHIHGRLWPREVSSVEEYNKTGIFRVYNFSSEEKGMREWCLVSATLVRGNALPQSLLLNRKEKAV